MFTLVSSLFLLTRYYAFESGFFDFGTFCYSFTSATRDLTKITSLILPAADSLIGHSSPILLLILPFYAVWPDPTLLLLITAFALGASVVPLYFIASGHIKNKTLVLLLCATYLVNPVVFNIGRYDFHPAIFVPFFLLSAFFFYERQNFFGFLSFVLLANATHEFMPIVTSFMALSLFLKDRFDRRHNIFQNHKNRIKKYFLLCVVIVGIVWFSVHTLLQAYFDPTTPVTNWLVFGKTSVSVVNDKIYYFLLLFSPLLFIPFLEPILLLPILPYLGVLVFANHPGYWSVYYQYGAFTIPFLFYSLTIALAKLKDRTSVLSIGTVIKRLFLLLLIANIAFAVNYSAISPLSADSWAIPTTHDIMLNSLLTSVPKNCTILTQSQIYPHLTDRTEVALYESDFAMRGRVISNPADFIIFDTTQKTFYETPALFNFSLAETVPFSRRILELADSGNYGLYSAGDGAYILKKDFAGELATAGRNTFFLDVDENWLTYGTYEKLRFGIGLLGGKGVGALFQNDQINLSTDSFSLSYMLQVVNSYGTDSWAGILIGYKDANNYISLNLRYPGGHITLVSVKDGQSEENVIGSIPFPSSDYQFFYLTIDNGLMDLYVNHEPITTFRLDGALLQGKLGLINWQQDTNIQLMLLTET